MVGLSGNGSGAKCRSSQHKNCVYQFQWSRIQYVLFFNEVTAKWTCRIVSRS